MKHSVSSVGAATSILLAGCSVSGPILQSTPMPHTDSISVTDISASDTDTAVVLFLSARNMNESAAYETYSAGANELLRQAGAVTIGRVGLSNRLVGSCEGTFLGYATAPSKQALLDVFSSDEYRRLVPERDKAFTSMNLYITGSNEIGENDRDLGTGTVLVTFVTRQSNVDGPMPDLKDPQGFETVISFKVHEQIAGECSADKIRITMRSAKQNWLKYLDSSVDNGTQISGAFRSIE